MAKWIILCGGHVISKSDGQTHYVSANDLVRLYGVDRKECLLLNPEKGDFGRLQGVDLAKCIVLRPRYHGDYGAWLSYLCGEYLRSHPNLRKLEVQ